MNSNNNSDSNSSRLYVILKVLRYLGLFFRQLLNISFRALCMNFAEKLRDVYI